MEKLLEILIAIGDEVACLSVADLIRRHWPSHSRALRVKKTIKMQSQYHLHLVASINWSQSTLGLSFLTKEKHNMMRVMRIFHQKGIRRA